MRRLLLLVVSATALAAAAQAPAPVAPRAALSQPALSPDGQEIAFAAQGAIWTVPAQGGPAHLLIASSATDSRPLYSPDGQWLAFESTRTGNPDIYLFQRSTGAIRRLTFDDGADSLDSFSPDSQWLYFSSSSHNIGGMNDIYRVRLSGGTPLPVSAERYVSQYYAAAVPGGDGSLAVVTLGEMGLSQWWRNGHAHIDNTEIWRVSPPASDGAKVAYTRLLPTDGAKNLWPMWSRDGRTLYFMSDRSGAENIWELPQGAAQPRPLTTFKDGRVLFPSIAADGDAIVFERDFSVWRLDLKKNRAAAVPVQLLGAPPAPAPDHESLSTTRELAVSPDGKKAAFTAHGEVFATGTEHGGDAIRVTHTGMMQFDLAWSPDNHDLAFVSDRDGNYHIYQYDFATDRETQLTRGSQPEFDPVYSPDGKLLVFQRGVTDAVVLNLASGAETVVAHGYLSDLPPNNGGGEFAWSPDSRYLAYRDSGQSGFPNVFIVSANGNAPGEQVSFLANTFGGALQWSPDGKYILLQTGQRTEPTRIARVDLVPRLPQFREDAFQKLFENLPRPRGGRGDNAAAAAPVHTPDPVFTGIERRASLLPMLNVRGPVISPDGKWLAYVSSEGGRGGNIYLMSLDDSPAARRDQAPKQLTTTTTGKSALQFTADSKDIYYLAGGHIERVAVAGGPSRPVNFTADLTVDFNREKEEMFAQAWRTLRDTYMNPAMNGVDWNAVHARYAPEVAASRTPDDLRRVLVEMIGDMNSSHSGIGAPAAASRRIPTGHLGLFFDRVRYESQGQLCVTEVVPLGPGALGGARVGDCLVSVDGAKIGPAVNLDQVLQDTVGRKLTVVVAREGAPNDARGGATQSLALQPVAAAAGKQLIYDAWVEHNRQLVAQLSHGQLGYIHMAAMGQPDLDKLYLDLDSTDFAKRGVVVDVRNNNGGFVNAYALDVLTRRPYLTMIPRDFPAGPARVRLGQRALEKPTVLVTNQNSLSDSEDFTEGYEAMHLGKVVGLPTAGWIIFTGGTTLIDGSSLRLPSTRILDHNGKDMELHPRPVDVQVANPLGSWQDGKDPQLAAAVQTLLQQLGPAPAAKIAAGKDGQHQ